MWEKRNDKFKHWSGHNGKAEKMELSLRHWIALSTIYTVYIIFGAIVYYRMERKAEIVSRRETLRARTDVNGE